MNSTHLQGTPLGQEHLSSSNKKKLNWLILFFSSMQNVEKHALKGRKANLLEMLPFFGEDF